MENELRPDRMYMMPVHFGPHCGPRQRPNGQTYTRQTPQNQMRVTVCFETSASHLEKWLPPGFQLWNQPIVTVEMSELREVEWLAGRGYNTLGVAFPAKYTGGAEPVCGLFLAVLWENLADPIITGREQLGFSKIFANIEDLDDSRGILSTAASWDGFEFFRMRVKRGERLELNAKSLGDALPGEGLLHYKYIPRTGGAWDAADADYATLSPWPTTDDGVSDFQVWSCEGQAKFLNASWQQLPTQFRIVNALAGLPVHQWLPARLMRLRSAADYRNQRVL